MSNFFSIHHIASNSSARFGIIKTDHGDIETPVFMPVGTYGAVKTLSTQDLLNINYPIILGNTYHLYIRPGVELFKETKGLHHFMNWNKPILTDSGGFQIYSLKGKRKISDDGVTFQSHLDGSYHLFTPEKVIDIQRAIGSDFMMMLDVCPASDGSKQSIKDAVTLTSNWAHKGMKYFNDISSYYNHKQTLIPIVQGGTDSELRAQSTNDICKLDAQAYAIGGLAVGEPKDEMLSTVELMNQLLPKDKPRYLMGVGTPADLVRCINLGVDMFDCVMPTRNARNAQLFTWNGKINIRNSKYKDDHSAIDEDSSSFYSTSYSKSYLHHLFKIEEILGYRIATLHNLHFYFELVKSVKKNIKDNTFELWSKEFLNNYEIDNEQ